jgi:hypothetical protein
VDVVYRRCRGIDVHKRTVAACVSLWEEDNAIRKDKRIFGTTTGELRCLAEWLSSHGITHIAMEATGVYWEPCGMCWTETGTGSCGLSIPNTARVFEARRRI